LLLLVVHTVEVQFQLLHRVRHTKENKLYLWIDRPGEGKKGIPSKKQIRKELDKNHEDGKKMSPSLLSMPPWLKNLYICELQEMHRSKRKLNDEDDRLLAKEHYVTKDIGIIKNDNMEEFKYPVPNFSSIRDLNLKNLYICDEHSKAERNIWFGQATEEQKIAKRKRNLLKYIDVEKAPEEVDLLWERCKRNKNIRPILCNASLEAGKVTIQEFQISDYKRNIFSKLSNQQRAKFEVVSALNQVLALETLFAGNSMPIKRKDFTARVKLIIKNE